MILIIALHYEGERKRSDGEQEQLQGATAATTSRRSRPSMARFKSLRIRNMLLFSLTGGTLLLSLALLYDL